jgi:hypothetical protein
MKYTRPPMPPALFLKIKAVSKDLGYIKKAHHWQLLDFLLDYAQENPTTFKKR